ncbi:MAG: hypothetical protein ISS94_00030 [Candidatus Syntrophoarchaeum sp.]|nr:hypothetical protein [Candidatus Syntrophoarchaeum sp.]
MRRRLIQTFVIALFFLCVSSFIVSTLAQSDKNSTEAITLTESKYVGVCYGPFRDNEAPGYYPTLEERREDINFISKLASSIRAYGMAGTLSEIPKLCQEAVIDCYPGAWISKQKEYNEREIQSLIQVANQNLSCVKGLIVGNEVLLREDISENELIEYIRRVKDNTTIPVSTAEIWGTWLEHPQLAENVDFIIVHIHPYWEGYPYGEGHPYQKRIPVNEAAEHVVEKWMEVKAKYANKTVIVGETGWPTQGDKIGEAVPSEENQRIFLSDFLQLAEENNIPYFYFDVFDEKCKKCSEEAKEVEAHWGLYYSNGSLKPLLKDLVPEEAREGFYRLPRERKVPLPWFIYKAVWSPENHFIPSGWMGDLEDWAGDPKEVFDDACTDTPYSGDTCVRITYSPGSKGWSGIYWQFPENNWGKCLGYDISSATKLTFLARGENGSEKAEFKTGGISSPGKPFHDSFGPVSTDVIELTKEWKEYTINLSEQNLSMVIGGFCWVTDRYQNPEGCTIYLDEISFIGLSVNFDTRLPKNPYPSIFGTHNGTIKPNQTITVSKHYTYPCTGTGGHTEYMKIWNSSDWNVTAIWEGYSGDWHNISFDNSFTLEEGETYYYTIRTGSYPQIHHTDNLSTSAGFITCSEFMDANGKRYDNWIPAIKLF